MGVTSAGRRATYRLCSPLSSLAAPYQVLSKLRLRLDAAGGPTPGRRQRQAETMTRCLWRNAQQSAHTGLSRITAVAHQGTHPSLNGQPRYRVPMAQSTNHFSAGAGLTVSRVVAYTQSSTRR